MKGIFSGPFFLVLKIIILFIIIRFLLTQIPYFKKISQKNITSLLLSVIIIFCFNMFYFTNLTKINQIPFNESIWVNSVNERHKMIDDLFASNYFIGKSKSQIIKIFGLPKNETTQELQYDLIGRTWSEFKIYNVKLSLDNNKVVDFRYELKE